MYRPGDVPTLFSCSSVGDKEKQHPYLEFLFDKNLKVGSYRSENYPRDDESIRQLRATYFGLMTEVDDNVGRIVNLLKNKYVHFAAMPPLLFDIKNDPAERHNLAKDPGYSELVFEYVGKLLSWRMRNDERALTGMRVGPQGLDERGR
jgi:arylsulfatase A-like enzyme